MTNMTDAQIVTSALASEVCDLFIAQTVDTLLCKTRSISDFVNAVRQGYISNITLTGDAQVCMQETICNEDNLIHMLKISL